MLGGDSCDLWGGGRNSSFCIPDSGSRGDALQAKRHILSGQLQFEIRFHDVDQIKPKHLFHPNSMSSKSPHSPASSFSCLATPASDLSSNLAPPHPQAPSSHAQLVSSPVREYDQSRWKCWSYSSRQLDSEDIPT